jgi:ribosome-binding protein aMBF1 (putative translation factor)
MSTETTLVEPRRKRRDAMELLDEWFPPTERDLELREHYRNEVDVARLIREARAEAGLTQEQLAARLGTHRSAICRLEDSDYEGHSMAMLRRVAAALGKCVEMRLVDACATPSTTGGNDQAEAANGR